jgi:membrane-anchored mycosin MYCP
MLRVLAAAAVLAVALVAAPASAADRLPACAGVSPDQPQGQQLGDVPAHGPLAQIGVPAARQWLSAQGKAPGAGVTVAVVDSGVGGGLPLAPGSARGRPTYFHGTAVAGVITAIAPGVRLLDLPVYAEDQSQGPRVSAAGVRDAFDALVAHPEWGVSIVNASLEVGDDPALAADVAALRRRGMIVVASTGNRLEASGVPSTYQGGEDFAKRYFPAGYDGVLGVSAVAPPGGDTTAAVLANSATDVTAPTLGLTSVSLLGTPCLLDDVATSWATAEVSGVMALLRSAYPSQSAARLVARLEDTASGRPDVRTDFAGAGVVQADQALTRPLALSPAGVASAPAVPRADDRASVPPPAPDALAGTRHVSVWWGLLGGGALLLALVLRPVLSRRR